MPALVEKNQANSTADSSRGGSAILGSLLVGCIYLLSRSSGQKNTDFDQTTTAQK